MVYAYNQFSPGEYLLYDSSKSSLLEPDLFACAVAQMGVYDLTLLHETGAAQKKQRNRAYLNRTLGKDLTLLQQQSPIHHLDKLKTPLLIIHGEKDKRAPIEHAHKLIKKLKALNKPYQWMELETGAHSYYRPELREAVYERVLGFVQGYLQ